MNSAVDHVAWPQGGIAVPCSQSCCWTIPIARHQNFTTKLWKQFSNGLC